MAKVEFHFDFGSPNAYLAHLVVPEIEQRTGVKFDYVPILLGGVFKLTNNSSPAEKLAGIKNRLQYEHLEMQRFIRRHGITTFKWNPFFPVNTLLIMRGAIAAGLDGVFAALCRRNVQAYVGGAEGHGRSGRGARPRSKQSGFDAERLLARTQEQDVKDKLLKNTQEAVDRGAFGSPTFFVGNEIFFGKDRLRDVEEEIAAQQIDQASAAMA